MNKKKILWIIFILVLIFISGTIFTSRREQTFLMSFEVTIPQNTPADDTVYIYLPEQSKYKMNKVGDFLYQITLNKKQLLTDDQKNVRYRYGRNGANFLAAEYLEPDTNNYFWNEMGRTTKFEKDKVQKDTINRWRWFPEGQISKTTAIEPSGNFLPRINGTMFRSGQTIEDLYMDSYYDFFNSTATHLKEQNFNWIELDPPWQWIEVDGMPKVSNEFKTNPNYPDDATFLAELRAYKQAGLKVMVAPQICCTEINTKNRSIEWWNAYFAETEQFLLHFATLAEQEDVEAFLYAVPSWLDEDQPVDTANRWKQIFTNIKKVFSGELGEMIWVLGPEVSPTPQLIPDPEKIGWLDALDFFLVATDFPLSIKDDPTDQELKAGADAVVAGTKILYEELKKPVILRNGYFNVKYSWKGQSFYSLTSFPWLADPESAAKERGYEFSAEDHARTLNAQFRSISEAPWIIGYFHFGYGHWENPLLPWMSVRGTPAEDIWKKWNGVISNN